jgi:hypothetical protein
MASFKSATDAVRVANNRRTSGPCAKYKSIKGFWTEFINRWYLQVQTEEAVVRSQGGKLSYTDAATIAATNVSLMNNEFEGIDRKCKNITSNATVVHNSDLTTDYDPYDPSDLFAFSPSATADQPAYNTGFDVPPPPAIPTKPVDRSSTRTNTKPIPNDPATPEQKKIASAGGSGGMLLLGVVGFALVWLIGRKDK